MRLLVTITTLIILLLGCENIDNKETKSSKKKKKDGIVKQYWPNGNLKTELNLKNGKRHGVAKSFYKDGKLRQVVEYINNVKHGEAKTFYENGKTYQLTPYQNGKIHGIRKKYRTDGRLMAEVPYQEGNVCKGLKEYLTNGKLKTIYPSIEFRAIDKLLSEDKFILRVKMSDNSKSVKYYIGIMNDTCITSDLMRIEPQRPGVLELTYYLPPSSFKMEEIHVTAKVKTKLGNEYLTSGTYNLAIENKGF